MEEMYPYPPNWPDCNPDDPTTPTTTEELLDLHCDCRADDWVEGDEGAVRCVQCGGYAGEPGTSIRLRAVS